MVEQVFPGLFIVIVNYNLREDTIECIDSYLNAGAVLDRIIVVDNASTDGSVEALKTNFDRSLTIIVAPDNKGYPHALNLGIPKALKMGAEWVLLSNNDVVADRNMLQELEIAAHSNPEVALISPLILYHSEPTTIWFVGHRMIPGTLIGIDPYKSRYLNKKMKAVMRTDILNSCAMAIRHDVFETIGLFDDNQLIYGDDTDFSWRAKLAGFQAISATRAKLWHKISKTMGVQKPRTRYLRTRNIIGFYRRYAHGLTYFIMLAFTVCRGLAITIREILRGHPDLIPPLWRGWWDGWSGNFTISRY